MHSHAFAMGTVLQQSTAAEILEAVERAKAFKLCLRRIWAVAGSLPNREYSLPTLIPVPGMFPVPSHDRQHQKHDQCTFDFCEYSRVDFTSVPQRHERRCNDCVPLRFSLDVLDERVENEQPTAWKLEDRSMLDTSRPYMAISHVWADGTGTGTWGPGRVNKCLYEFFCDIARDFQCEGCWWDTISIPQGKEARGKALNNMHKNYANARITLVHDSYLREWEWVDAESACFAIVMSPWFSRGWTSLELTMSRKVKILFKSRDDRYVIKDLDVDILAETPSSARHHATAESIRKLRSTSINSFGNLLAILGPRDTSKPRDIPIISGLLAGVDVSGELSQQEIYQRILRKLKKVAQGHLFHNSASMSSQGFNWCPTNILDMPPVEGDSADLQLQENGDLVGEWKVYRVSDIAGDDYIWKDTHPLTRVALESALRGDGRENHLLLVETESSNSRALLARLMKSKEETTATFRCQLVGPIYFRSVLGAIQGQDYQKTKIRIGSTERLQELTGNAWEYMCSRIAATNASAKGSTVATVPSKYGYQSQASLLDEDDPVSLSSRSTRGLFYAQEEASNLLFDESEKLFFPEYSEEMTLLFVEYSENSMAFLYGNKEIFKSVRSRLNQNVKGEVEQIMLLAADRDDEIRKDLVDTKTKTSLEGKALLTAADIGLEPLITVLLDNHAPHIQDSSGRTALHLATASGHVGVVEKLLTSTTSPANAEIIDSKGQMAIHIAAENGFEQIVMRLLEKTESLDAQEDTMGFTALHFAAKEGHSQIARLLLSKNVNSNIEDLGGQTALHWAAKKNHHEIVEELLQHGVDANKQDQKQQAALHLAASKGHSETTRLLIAKANPDVRNKEEQTALHLAAQKGHTAVVEVLLECGAEASGVDSRQKTALQLAAENGYSKTVLKLFETNSANFSQEELNKAQLLAAANKKRGTVIILYKNEAKSGLQDSAGMTALHWTIQNNDGYSAKLLIETQADVDIEDEKKQTALLIAAGKGDKDTVDALLDKGADLNHQDWKIRTALHLAAIKCHEEVIKRLFDSKCKVRPKVELKDSSGRTALHWAALKGLNEATQLILYESTRHIAQDNDDRTALILAAEKGRAAVVKTLLKHGSDPKTLDKNGKTALDWAATGGYDEVVRELLGEMKAPTLDKYKQQALELAVKRDHSLVVMMLLDGITDQTILDSVLPTALFFAATNGHATMIGKLFDRGADFNYQDSQGRTALILAAERRQLPVIEALLSIKTKTDLQDAYGRTALIIAAAEGQYSIVNGLLRANADPNIQGLRESTALHFAVKRGHRQIVSELLYAKADPDVPDSDGRTALLLTLGRIRAFTVDEPHRNANLSFLNRKEEILAHSKSRAMTRKQALDLEFEMILYLLLSENARLDVQDRYGQTALHWAVSKYRYDIAEKLLRRHRNLDIEDKEGYTPLLLAAERGDSHLVELLLSFQFQPNVQNKKKQTALMLAAENGDNESAVLLLNNKADPNLSDLRGRTALLQAAQRGHELVVGTLLINAANPNARDAIGQTALLLAAENGDNESAVLLLNNKANPNLSDLRGRTALLQAAQRGHELVVGTLLINAANPNARDAIGRTALLVAAENGNPSIVAKLLKYGANPIIADDSGKNAWQKAVDQGHAHVVGIFLGAKLNIQIHDMESINEALLLASRKGWTSLVEVLLSNGADLTFQGEGRWTALHMACMSGQQEVVKSLTKKGIGMIIKDHKGYTALFKATETGFESIVRILLNKQEVSADIEGWMGRDALLLRANPHLALRVRQATRT